jgi:hypothetical protein
MPLPHSSSCFFARLNLQVPGRMQGEQIRKDLSAIGAYVTPAASVAALDILGDVKKWADQAHFLPGMPYASQKWDEFFKHCHTRQVCRHVPASRLVAIHIFHCTHLLCWFACPRERSKAGYPVLLTITEATNPSSHVLSRTPLSGSADSAMPS